MRKNPVRPGPDSTLSQTGFKPAGQDQGLGIEVGTTSTINTEWRGSIGRWASPRRGHGFADTPEGHGVMQAGFLPRRQRMPATPGSRYSVLEKVRAALSRLGSGWIRHRNRRLRMGSIRKAGQADRALVTPHSNKARAHKDSLNTVAPWRRTTSIRRAAAIQSNRCYVA